MFKNLFSKPSKQEVFWKWFMKNGETYFNFEQDQQRLFSHLHLQLKKIDKNLVFEFSPIRQDNTRELIISADGVKTSFPAVTDLVNAAPSLDKWQIVAFRQPRKGVNAIKYENLSVSYDNIFFKFGKDSGKIALELHIRDFYESTEWTNATFILLDLILGEYSTETYISKIDWKLLDEEEISQLYPITTLPNILDDYLSEQNN